MPLVNAKCTNCGGTLQVDNAKEAAVCPFCNGFKSISLSSGNAKNAGYNIFAKNKRQRGGLLPASFAVPAPNK